jgi:hypothetical protein
LHRVGNFRQKIIPRKTEYTKQIVISDGIPAVPRNRKFSEFRSEPFNGSENNSEFRSEEQQLKQNLGIPSNPSAEGKTTRNSVPWNKIRIKLPEFRSEPFRRRENNSGQNAAAAVYDSIQIESI